MMTAEYFNTGGLIIVALINLAGIILQQSRLNEVAKVVHQTELNTNTMKDSLVAAERKAANAEGKVEILKEVAQVAPPPAAPYLPTS